MPHGWRTNKRLNAIVLTISCSIILIGLFLLPYLIYYFFSPDELIRSTTAALENLTGTKIKIRDAKLSLVEGITFYDVRVLVPPDKLKLEPRFREDDGRLLRADTFQIQLRRKGLFGLKLRIGKVLVVNPVLTLTKLAPDNRWNWQMLFIGHGGKMPARRSFGLGPPVTIQNGKLSFTQIKDGQRMLLGNVGLSAEATPRYRDQVYDLHLSTWTGNVKGPVASLEFNPRSGEVLAGKLETISFSNIEQTLPEPYKGWIRRFKLAGNIGISEVEYKPEDKTKVILVLDGVRANVPMSQAEMNHPQGLSYLNLSDLKGKIIFTRKELIIPKLTGKLNQSPCQIQGTCHGYTTNPDQMGFNLRVACSNFTCIDYTDPKQRDYVENYMPWRLACFFRDFKPKGKLTFDLLLSKKPTPKAPVILSGRVQPNKCSAEYYKFPYRLDDVTGSVQITNGGFKLIGLTGYSAGGKALVNGTISEASRFAEINLEITSTRTPFDKKLFDALPPRYQQIWKKFDLAGFADSKINLYQPYGKNQPWQHKIRASLVDASGCYEGFKFPLTNLSGVLMFENEQLSLQNIAGRNGSTQVCVNGTVQKIEQPTPFASLNIRARDVAINDAIVSLIPPQPAQLIRDSKLAGTADLNGSLTIEPNKPIEYNFVCDLRHSALCYNEFPYPLKDLSAQLRVTPREIVISQLTAARGMQTIQGSGTIRFVGPVNQIAMKINADNLLLDSTMYKALAPSQRAIWDTIQPSGKISAQAVLERDTNKSWTWKLDLVLQKTALRYKSFPAVTDLEGQIHFKSRQAILKDVSGKFDGKGRLETDGIARTDGDNILVNLARLNLDAMPINDGFVSEIKDSKFATDLKLQSGGRLASKLTDVSIRFGPEKKQAWDMAGDISLTDARIGVFDVNPTDVNFAGRLAWNTSDSDFTMNGNFALKSFNWNDRRVENLRANLLKKSHDPVLTINDLRGTCAEGQVSGMGKIQFEPKQTTYGLQLTLDNLDAATVLKIDPRPNTIQGKMRGEVFMLGTAGQKYARRGAGTLQVSGAEVLKVPLMAQIYQTTSHEPPNLASFHDITVQFITEEHKVNLQHVELVGPAISLIGSGTHNLSNDRISLDVVAATPKNLSKLPVMSDLVQGASREFTELEIRGPIDHPTITARPLKHVSETLQTFFDGKTVR